MLAASGCPVPMVQQRPTPPDTAGRSCLWSPGRGVTEQDPQPRGRSSPGRSAHCPGVEVAALSLQDLPERCFPLYLAYRDFFFYFQHICFQLEVLFLLFFFEEN